VETLFGAQNNYLALLRDCYLGLVGEQTKVIIQKHSKKIEKNREIIMPNGLNLIQDKSSDCGKY